MRSAKSFCGRRAHIKDPCSCLMSSLTESKAAFVQRGKEVGLSDADVDALVQKGINSIAKLAFAVVPPGSQPTNQQVTDTYGTHAVNPGVIAATKRLIFESHTMVVADLKQRVEKGETPEALTMAPAEREARVVAQKTRLTGLMHTGVEEVAFESYNAVYSMLQQNTLVYHHPNRFITRQMELQAKKAGRELQIDGAGSLSVKDKPANLTCDTHTELEFVQALRRRALAYDLVGACSYEVMNLYHSQLVQRIQDLPPPGYMRVSVIQALRADRAAFIKIAELVRSVKPLANGTKPLDDAFSRILENVAVSFHLLPLVQPPPAPARPPNNKRKFCEADIDHSGKGRGNATKGKGNGGKTGKGRGNRIRVPKPLIGKWSQNRSGERLCWAFNMEGGCPEAKPGEACSRGLHLCCEPGCLKPHSLLDHK